MTGPGSPGTSDDDRPVRAATPADLPSLIAAADAVFRTPPRAGLGSMGHDYPLLFDPDNAGNLMIATAPDETPGTDPAVRVVGHAGFTLREAVAAGTALRVACLGAVFTAPAERNRGLGSRLFAAALDRARKAGAQLALVSGRRGMYQRAGFSPYPLSRRYQVPAADQIDATASTVLVPYQPGALPALMRLQAQEPVRYVRSEWQWRQLLQAGVLFYQPGRLFLVERGGAPVAYLAVALRLPAGGSGSPPLSARVLEVAGDRLAVAEAAPLLGQALGVASVEVVLPWFDRSLEARAAERRWPADDLALNIMSLRWDGPTDAPIPCYGLDYV